MKCPECGTEIADNALICFRCGASMYQAIHKPAPLKKRRPLTVYIVFVILVLVAVFIMYFRHA
jgi:uncharacterized membrane protein YvbJ